MGFLKKNFIFLTVFITGAAVLVIEVTATRILTPYFGNTLFVISSILGVVLGGLSLGYFLGGILADKHPKFSLFFFLIFLAGIFSLLIQFFSKTILPLAGEILGIKFGPLISSCFLFFLPSLILGTISPFAIKLITLELKEVGRVSGKVFFWSTLGSIFGSFLTGFYLIPHFGTRKILFYNGLLLLFLGYFGIWFSKDNGKKNYFLKFILVLFLIIILALSSIEFLLPKSTSIIFQKEGLYGPIIVEEILFNGKKIRVLRFDPAYQAGVFLDSDDLPFEYTKYYSIYEIINPQAEKALFLGGGGYTTPRRLLLDKNNIKRIDVVEIEPSLYQIAKQYFKLEDDPRLVNHIGDGRRFLKETNEKYDFIFSDVYSSLYFIPVHFTTQEFFSLAKSKLKENGFFLINIIGALEPNKNQLLFSIVKTFQKVFENSYLFAVQSPSHLGIQNFILVGLKNPAQKIDFTRPEILESESEIIRSLPQKIVDLEKLNLDSAFIFTDDFAPLEYLTAKLF